MSRHLIPGTTYQGRHVATWPSRDLDVPVVDHEYVGNVCSGFGAPTTCQAWLGESGPCGRSRLDHRKPKHRGEPRRTA